MNTVTAVLGFICIVEVILIVGLAYIIGELRRFTKESDLLLDEAFSISKEALQLAKDANSDTEDLLTSYEVFGQQLPSGWEGQK